MKKTNIATLLALTVSGTLLGAASKDSPSTAKTQTATDPAYGSLGYHLMTEDELLSELNDEGTKLYQSLSPEGKALVRKMASARCNGTNDCAGLNACATDKNSCAGKGKCKGQGKCSFADKNLAVKLVADKMAKKRAHLSK